MPSYIFAKYAAHKVLSKSIIKSFFLVEKEFLSKWSNHKEKLFITLGEMTAPIEKKYFEEK